MPTTSRTPSYPVTETVQFVSTDQHFDLDLLEVREETAFAFTTLFPAVPPPLAQCPSEDKEIEPSENLDSLFLRDDVAM